METPTSALLLLVLISLSGVLSRPSLDGKVFVFPTVSSDAYVVLHPALKEQLQHFTLCLRFFTDLTRSFSFVSVASQQHDNEILLFKRPEAYEVCVGGRCIDFHAPRNMDGTSSHWGNICTTWDSTTGIVQLWLDGQPLPRKGVAKGYKVQKDVVMMLGQDQDSYGGSLDA
ncbi:mucosal pentraxin-like, partial [Sceloporus undulatus]|uniref:mucosal pentraxin-like n=1 Tax=Sceloporus undulatus TaxID=8520 RepID=UPI001C4DA7BC